MAYNQPLIRRPKGGWFNTFNSFSPHDHKFNSQVKITFLLIYVRIFYFKYNSFSPKSINILLPTYFRNNG